MLSLQKQSKFIRKTIQLPNGAWAYVVFELIEVNGKITAKAVCGKLIEESVISQEEILALPVYFDKETIEPVASPFFADVLNLIKDLSFTTCQSTRAPNL